MRQFTLKNDLQGENLDVFDTSLDDFPGNDFESMNVSVDGEKSLKEVDFKKIDEFVENEDYMGYSDFLESCPDTQRQEIVDYINFYHKEFLSGDEEENYSIDSMKKAGIKNAAENIVDILDKKIGFNDKAIKADINDVLEGYKNAA